jgi:hypothetical protein
MTDENKLNKKAVIIGLLVDIAGSIVASLIIAVAAGIIMGANLAITEPGLKSAEISARIEQQLTASVGFNLSFLFIALFFTGLGGYIAAKIAKIAELKHALAVGILSLLTGVLITIIFRFPVKTLFDWSGYLLTIPFAVLGGYVRIKTKK